MDVVVGPLALLRFIPRRLGRGPRAAFAAQLNSVHPQAAGERVDRSGERRAGGGSSPGGWGEGRRAVGGLGRVRFIPRRLGRGGRRWTRPNGTPVHPQAAGERRQSLAKGWTGLGSSPGGWGEDLLGERDLPGQRFIPRRLGRGSPRAGPSGPRTVHPQAAGERYAARTWSASWRGSSPGGWGEERGRRRADGGRRFIPRRLGRGWPAPRPRTRPTVHPQAAGERSPHRFRYAFVSGSSPGGWGEVAESLGRLGGGRFIPRRLGRGRGRT